MIYGHKGIHDTSSYLQRAKHSGLRSKDGIIEKVALEVKAQEGFGHVDVRVLG